MRHLPQGLGERAKVNLLPPRQNSTNWLFSKSPKSSASASGAWRHSYPWSHPWSHPLSGIFILTSVNDTSSPRAHQHLRSSLHLNNPCTKRKVLSLTKPKGRIYKTKSPGHYITLMLQGIRPVTTKRRIFFSFTINDTQPIYGTLFIKKIIALYRYSGLFLKWTRKELQQMDQRTRRLMTMHKVLHPRDDTDTACPKKRRMKRTRQYSREHWCIDTTTQRLHKQARKETDYSYLGKREIFYMPFWMQKGLICYQIYH